MSHFKPPNTISNIDSKLTIKTSNNPSILKIKINKKIQPRIIRASKFHQSPSVRQTQARFYCRMMPHPQKHRVHRFAPDSVWWSRGVGENEKKKGKNINNRNPQSNWHMNLAVERGGNNKPFQEQSQVTWYSIRNIKPILQ